MGLLEDFGNSKTNSKLQSLSNAKEGKLLELFNYQSTGGASTLHYDTPTTQSGAQLQQELSNAVDQQVYTAPDGSKYQEQYDKDANGNTVITKVPFTGQMRDLYIDNTPQGNMKLGLARTDQGGFTGRYDPAMHPTWDKLKDGELAGPMGVTRKDGPLMNITMPHNAATRTEYDVHSNIGQIRNRAAGQGPMTPQDTANFGAGKTEYTTQNAPMWNQDYRDPGTPLLAGTPMPKDAKLSAGYKVTGFKPYENLDLSPIDLTGSETQAQGDYGVKDFITTMSSAANKLGSKFEHGAGEALDTIGKWQKAYDKKHPPKDPNAVGSNWGKSFSDGLQKAGKILKDDAKYGDMLGEIYYKPTNAGQSMTRDVWKELKQGNVVKALDNVTVAGTLDTIAQSLPEMTMYGNPATFVALYGANVADAIKEYQDQNPGQEPSKGRLGAMMIGEAVSMGIEKLAIGRIITPTDMIVKAEGVLVSLANKIPAAVLKEATVYTTKKIGGLVEAATWEGGQEVLQEGQRIGTTQYGTGRDLMSEVNIDRLGESFVGGAAAGGGMHGAVETPGTISDVLSGTKKATDQGLTKLAETTTGKTAQEVRTKAAVNDIVKTEVQKRRVEPTEGMSDSDLEVVNDINSQLDTIGQLDPTKPDYQATVNEILQMADATKEHLSTPTVETTPETPEVKTEEKPTETYDEPTSKRLEAAGLSNVLTKEDRESNVRIELIKDGETRSVLDSRKKDLVFDPATMDDTFIESTIAEGVDESTIKSKLNPKNPAINFVNRVLKKLGRGTEQHKEMQTIYNDVKESFNNPKAMEQLEKISPDGKMTPAKAMRAVAIAANAIESAAESEVHIAAMHGQKNPGGARVPGLDVQIGKEYLNSFGLKVAGGSKESAAKYAIYGRAILNYMEQAGMTTTTKKPVALHNEVNEAGVRITDANKAGKIFEPATTSGKSPSAFMQVVQFNRGDLNTDTGRYPKVDAVNTFSKLFRPVNYKLPSTEASKEVSYDKSNPISREREQIVRDYQALKYHVKYEMIQLIKEIRDTIRAEGKTTDQALTEPKYKRLLGLHHTNAAIYALSASGRSINKKKNLIDLIDNIDEIEAMSKEGFYYTYDIAIQDRIHVMETLLELQGDKFMSRQMVTQGEMSVAKGTDEYKMLTDDIADNLPKGMKRDVEYVEGTKSNKWLDTAMKTIEENGGKGLNLTQLLEYTNKLGFSSSFKALSVLQAIYDVRTAKNDVVKTQYMTEADARASGATNTLFNLAGIPKVQKVLDMMGMGFNKAKEAIDPYMVLVKAFKERYSDALFQETFGETLAKLDKAGLDERTLAKSPAMTSIYGQEASNAKKSMAKGIAEKLLENALADYNQNAVDLINEITGVKYTIEGTTQRDIIKLKQAAKLSELIVSGEEYIIFDTETTGLEEDHDIVQVGLVYMKGTKQVRTEKIFIPSSKNPKEVSPGKTQSAYDTWSKDVQEEYDATKDTATPELREKKLQEVKKLLGKHQLVAHNSSFDIKMLNANISTTLNNKVHDTLAMATLLQGSDDSKLSTLNKKYLGEEFNAHNALDDSIQLGKVLEKMNAEFMSTDFDTESIALEDISEKDVEKIVKYYQDNLTGGFVDSVNHAYPGIAAYREAMSIMYTALDKSKAWDGKIASAVEVLLGTSNRKNRMSVRKLMSLTTRDIEDHLLSYNEMMNNSTSFNVNLQHSVDAALLLMSIRDAMAKHGTKGVMTVHDAFYGDPKILKDIMKFYNHYTIEAAKKYDFLTMAVNELEAIRTDENTKDIDKALNDANKKIKDATGMDIKELYEAKMEYLNRNGGLKVRVLGNSEIDAGVVETTTEEKTPTTKEEVKAHNESTYISAKATLDAVRRAVVDEDVISAINAIDSMKVSKSHKELLEKVQEALYGTEMTLGDKYSGGYNAITIQKSGYGTFPSDKTEMNTDTLVEILAHEVDHAIQLGWMVENPDAVEMKYLDRVVQRISTVKDFSPETKRRVDYILNPRNGNYTDVDTQAIRQVSELVSILSNEPKVSEEILSKFGGSKKTILQTISDLIKKAYASFKELLGDKSVNDLQLDTDTIMSAIQSLDNNARANTLLDTVKGRVSNSNNVADAKDVHKEKWVDPFASLNDVISKQNAMISDWMIIWGDTMVENMGPPLSKWNDEMKTKYRLYNTAISMIRTGLYDSDWAKRMHQTLGIAGDTKEVILNKLHKLATDYQQESKQDLIEMERMDRQIKDTYSKNEQIKLNEVFSHTAIVELSRMPEIREKILDGSMKLSEALKEISTKLDAETISKLDEVAHYYVTGETTTNSVNVKYSGNISDAAYMYTTVKALSMIPGSQTMLKEMDAGLQKWMMSIAQINKDLSNEINEKGMGYDGTMHSTEARYRSDYDGHYTMDVHETVMETKLVTLQDLKKTENSSEYEWEVLKAPTEGTMGVIGRRSTGAGYKTGVGLELNRFTNGVMVSSEQSEYITKKLDLMKDDETRDKWLASNSMMKDGHRYRVLLDNKTKVEKMGVMQNAAHSLYRTYIHNKDLVASEAVRREVLENGVRKIESAKGMDILEKILQKNYEEGLKGERTQVHPFLNVTYDYGTFDDLRREYPMIAQHYKTPVGLTTYNDFHKKVQLVQRGVAEELLGHKNFSIFGETENRTAARWEAIYKKIVVLAKQKMVVMNPVKLLNDSITNMGVLSMMDMSPIEIYQGMKQGWNSYHEYSKERTKLVQLKMEARMDKSEKNLKALKRQEEKMKTMDFYDAHEAGFIQSYGTELVVKEFDTISGIQKDIDNVVDKYTHDVDGNPNALFKAIKWWMNAGVNVDEMLYATGKSAKLNGTTVGEELVAVSERLKNKKNDKESVSRYISEVIGAPASEAANYGGAYMVLSDALSKYVLAKHLMKRENPKSGKRGERRLYTKEEAYMKANETFIDYRRNIPSEISALSDYGILMFPAYWMRVQKVIGSLVKYQPLSVALSYGTEYAIGAESLNVVNQNIFSKANAYGGLIHTDPQRFMGPESIFAF